MYIYIYNITWTLDFMDKSLTSSTHEVEAANKKGIWVHYDAWAGGIWGVHWGELFLLGSWVEKYGVVMLKWDDLGCFLNAVVSVGILSRMGDVSMLPNSCRS